MNLEEYYKQYLTLHQNKWCRRLHFFGQLVTIFLLCVMIGHKVNIAIYLVLPFVIYPFAWSGHFFFEKNKPAAFSDPIKAKICDWIMFKDMILGKI
jgi:hypothetical protein